MENDYKCVSKVIQKEPFVIESEYFDVKYRPKTDNFDLKLKCSSLLTYFALGDINKNFSDSSPAYEHFPKVLASCKDQNDINEVILFLEEAAKIGTYAQIFFNEHRPHMSIEGVEAAKKEVRLGKVSRFISKKPIQLESKYFDIKYRPSGKNYALTINCSSFLTYLAMGDINRDKSSGELLDTQFIKILASCKDTNDLLGVEMFLNECAKVGGYAAEFFEKNRHRINSDEVQKAKNVIKSTREEKVEYEVITHDSAIEEFERLYRHANTRYEELITSKVIDTDNLDETLKLFRMLQDELVGLTGKMDKLKHFNYEEEVENKVNHLRQLAVQLEELDKAMNF